MSTEIKVSKTPILDRGGADDKSNAMREFITNTPDVNFGRKLVYYVANDGDDNNDGLSPETPFKTPERTMSIPKHNFSVLFKRGDTFRLTEDIYSRGHTTYAAYGEGPKPKILGSVRDYADPSIWNIHEGDIWVAEVGGEAGNIIFNNDSYVGERKLEYDMIEKDGDFHHDMANQKLYLKLSNGNPGEIFNNIEIATVSCIFKAWNLNNVQVDNLHLKYACRMGVNAVDCSQVNVTNCIIEWIGGAYIGPRRNRYGNGVEYYYVAKDCKVTNCYFNQIFDAALTFQGEGPGQTEFESIYFEDNLIEHTSMNFEYWVNHIDKDGNRSGDGIMHDIRFCRNIIRGAGYGWAGRQRPYVGDQGAILSWSRVFKAGVMKAFYFMDNIIDCADCSYIYAGLPSEQKEMFLSHNSYYQRKNTGLHNFTQIIRHLNLFAHNQEEFEFAIKHWDKNPDHVEWLNF